MSEVWAVILAGGLGFGAAFASFRYRESRRLFSIELEQRRKEIRKTALLITTYTPKDFGGCGGSRNRKLAVAKLKQLHTMLAVRLTAGVKIDLELLQVLDDLISDIESQRVGSSNHAKVINLVSLVLAEQERGKNCNYPVTWAIVDFFKWLYQLPEYLTEYDSSRKSN